MKQIDIRIANATSRLVNDMNKAFDDGWDESEEYWRKYELEMLLNVLQLEVDTLSELGAESDYIMGMYHTIDFIKERMRVKYDKA